MRVPPMTARQMMIAVAVVALVLAGFLAIGELERRSALYNRQAEIHRWKEEHLRITAAHLESMARDPARSYELLNALAGAKGRWQERAAAARLELMDSDTPGARWDREARDAAMKRARAYRQESEDHGREALRYERAAFEPWNDIAPDPASPE